VYVRRLIHRGGWGVEAEVERSLGVYISPASASDYVLHTATGQTAGTSSRGRRSNRRHIIGVAFDHGKTEAVVTVPQEQVHAVGDGSEWRPGDSASIRKQPDGLGSCWIRSWP
jgi:5-deoxy-D-glucuronate isomerase